MAKKTEQTVETQQPQVLAVTPPNFKRAEFTIVGNAPLVVHRMSKKLKEELRLKQETGTSQSMGKKKHKPQDIEKAFQESRYRSKEGWDGFHAGAIRKAMISACRLVNFKMTLAKLTIFVVADGYDEREPQVPLVRIYGKAVKQEDIARVETGGPYVTIRAAFPEWKAKVRIRWDADQFKLEDIANLLSRVGLQVGIGEGRPDSKNSAGMDWGTFDVTDAVV